MRTEQTQRGEKRSDQVRIEEERTEQKWYDDVRFHLQRS